MNQGGLTQRKLTLMIGFIFVSLYFSVQIYFNLNLALASDEFVFIRHIYDYTLKIPYKDFLPYKSTLGHYLLSIPFYFHDLQRPALWIKHEMALLNTIAFLVAFIFCSKKFGVASSFLTFISISVSQLFLIYATDIRVDLLTVWFSLLSIFFAYEYRFLLAGIWMGTAFLISQKALWYFLALNGVLCAYVLTTPAKLYFKYLLRFNFAFFLTLMIYIAIWSYFSSFTLVLTNLFYDAYIQAKIDYYSSIYLLCWIMTVSRGPFLFLILPYFIAVIIRSRNAFETNLLLWIAIINLLFFISYKQPFPYNFVFTIPSFMFISILFWQKLTVSPSYQIRFHGFYLYCLSSYLIGLIFFITILSLPKYFYLMLLFPIATESFFFIENIITRSSVGNPSGIFKWRYGLRSIIGIMFTLFAILYPLHENFASLYNVNNHYQNDMLAASESLLKNEGDYIAGIPFFYQKDQPILAMRNLIGPALEYLYHADQAYLPLFLESIYLTPGSEQQILTQFSQQKIKLIINNYRIESLPRTLLRFLKNNYYHLYGSLYYYGPKFSAKTYQCNLKFSGVYQAVTPQGPLIFDGKILSPHTPIPLKAGNHYCWSVRGFRLKLQPNIPSPLTKKYPQEKLFSILKPILT